MTAPCVHELRLEEPNQINGHFGWDIDFRQLERGSMKTQVLFRPSENITLLELQMNQGVHQTGISPRGAITFGLPVTPALRSWNGNEAPQLVNFGMAKEFDAVNGADFVGLTVTISEPFFASISNRLGCHLPKDCLQGVALPVGRGSTALRRLREVGRSFLYQPGTPFDEAAQDDFVAALFCATDDAEPILDGTLSLRTKSVRAAVNYIREQTGTTIPVSELCAVTGVSWRTLDRGFREQFGIGPKAYLNRIRLAGARSELLRMAQTSRVADAANKWGFWHMGQFAKDYYRMFGELPSETLNGTK